MDRILTNGLCRDERLREKATYIILEKISNFYSGNNFEVRVDDYTKIYYVNYLYDNSQYKFNSTLDLNNFLLGFLEGILLSANKMNVLSESDE